MYPGYMIVIDLKTTGPNTKKNSIISIGAVDFSNPVNQFYQECRMRAGSEFDIDAIRKIGLTVNDIDDPTKQSLDTLIKEFMIWSHLDVNDRTLAGVNPSYDTGFLKYSYKYCGRYWDFGYNTIDLHSLIIAHKLRLGNSIKLGKARVSDLNLVEFLFYLGINHRPLPNNTLDCAKLKAEAFSRIIYRKSMFDEFKSSAIPEYL